MHINQAMKDLSLPTVGHRTTLDPSIEQFLSNHPSLALGGSGDFCEERREHTEVFGFHRLSPEEQAPIGKVEFTAIRGPHGTIPIRVLYPKSLENTQGKENLGALIYFHGGGYTVGTVDEFENGLRIVAEEAAVQVYAVEYRLTPEWRFPTQLDEYDCVVDWLQGDGGNARGVSPDKVCGGGDSAGGNMTAALCLRRKDEGKKPLAAQVLLYPEARLPFDTPAATENNSGLYLECNGIFSFADHYLPRGTPPGHRYISPGMQPDRELKELPEAAVFTCGFDPLRDVGVEYASKLTQARNTVHWQHYPALTHGFLQMCPWSEEALEATKDFGRCLKTVLGCFRVE